MKKAKMHIVRLENDDVMTTSAGTDPNACSAAGSHFLATSDAYPYWAEGSNQLSWQIGTECWGHLVIDVVRYNTSDSGWTTDGKTITYLIGGDGSIQAGQWLAKSPLGDEYIQLCTGGTHDHIIN